MSTPPSPPGLPPLGRWLVNGSSVFRLRATPGGTIENEVFFILKGALGVQALHDLALQAAADLNEAAEKREAKTRWGRATAQAHRDHPGKSLEFGNDWECPTSPTKFCVYDPDKDPCRDCCLYCKDPLERK